MTNRPSLMIGIPIERTIDQRAFWSFMAIAQQGWPIGEMPYTRHDVACNKIIAGLLDSTHDYVLILDSFRQHAKGIVAQIGQALADSQADVIASAENGAVLISKEIFKEWPPPWLRYPADDYKERFNRPGSWEGVWGEFYDNARSHGAKVVANDRIVSPHVDDCPSAWESYLLSTPNRTDRDVLIAIPIERVIHQNAFHPFLRIAQRGYSFIVSSYKRCDQARQEAALRALEWRFHLLAMLDSDHVHHKLVVQRLMAAMVGGSERLVVGGLNYRRSEPYDPLAGWWTKGERGWDTTAHWPNQVIEVGVMGTGCVVINTEAFHRMPSPWFGYDYDAEEPDDFPGVDIWFSRLCNKHGIKLWLEPRVTSPHLADMMVTGALFEKYREAAGLK